MVKSFVGASSTIPLHDDLFLPCPWWKQNVSASSTRHRLTAIQTRLRRTSHRYEITVTADQNVVISILYGSATVSGTRLTGGECFWQWSALIPLAEPNPSNHDARMSVITAINVALFSGCHVGAQWLVVLACRIHCLDGDGVTLLGPRGSSLCLPQPGIRKNATTFALRKCGERLGVFDGPRMLVHRQRQDERILGVAWASPRMQPIQ
jgi:hypothetical protein